MQDIEQSTLHIQKGHTRMPRVMFTVTYGIKPELRQQYLALVNELTSHLVQQRKMDYAVYELKGKKNTFTEVFTLPSVEEFDAMDENQDERTEDLVSKVQACADGTGIRYSTLLETA